MSRAKFSAMFDEAQAAGMRLEVPKEDFITINMQAAGVDHLSDDDDGEWTPPIDTVHLVEETIKLSAPRAHAADTPLSTLVRRLPHVVAKNMTKLERLYWETFGRIHFSDADADLVALVRRMAHRIAEKLSPEQAQALRDHAAEEDDEKKSPANDAGTKPVDLGDHDKPRAAASMTGLVDRLSARLDRLSDIGGPSSQEPDPVEVLKFATAGPEKLTAAREANELYDQAISGGLDVLATREEWIAANMAV